MMIPTDGHPDRDDDCLSGAVATLLSLPIEEVPYHKPNTHSRREFWSAWRESLEEMGYRLVMTLGNNGTYRDENGDVYPPMPTRGNWIAVVPSLGDSDKTHAVVMRGRKLFHDPSGGHRRKRRPKVIFFGLRIVPREEHR